MSDYAYAKDGKLHTRFSELLRCTPGQIDRVIAERNGAARVETEAMLFGTDRHQMWQEETEKSLKTPQCFDEVLPYSLSISHIEQEFATEILPGVIIHSRPDAISLDARTIIDYKTVKVPTNGDYEKSLQKYYRSLQLKFYGYQLSVHGIRVQKGIYLCEVWNQEQTEIVAYKKIVQEYKLSDMAAVLPWIRARVSMLAAALEA